MTTTEATNAFHEVTPGEQHLLQAGAVFGLRTDVSCARETEQSKETPLPRVCDEFSGALDEHTGKEHQYEDDR